MGREKTRRSRLARRQEWGGLRGARIIISAMGYTTYAGGRAEEVGLAPGGSPFLLPWFALLLALTTPLTIYGPITESCIASAIGLSGNRVSHRADWHCQRRDMRDRPNPMPLTKGKKGHCVSFFSSIRHLMSLPVTQNWRPSQDDRWAARRRVRRLLSSVRLPDRVVCTTYKVGGLDVTPSCYCLSFRHADDSYTCSALT